MFESLKNFSEPQITVTHSTLVKASEDSLFRVFCPVCDEGLLFVGRDQTSFELLARDRCISCGQSVYYSDIEDLRKLDPFS